MAPHKIIIDTDPGVDDMVGLLLSLSASPEELDILLISVTYGNVPLKNTLKNTVALFHVLEKELEWRKSVGRDEGYGAMRKSKPIVAVGPVHPLEEEELMLDYFHGVDGLHNVYEAHPHLTPAETWKTLFHDETAADATSPFFTPSKTPGHKEILRILREEPADTVSILVWGPLTNIAIAAAEDPETLLKVKEVVVMGGAVHHEGNVTPVAEFNCYADPVAAARVYALTSKDPKSTMPPMPHKIPDGMHVLPPYPEKLSRTLKLTLCPLDITTPHQFTRVEYNERIKPYLDAGSPLATWTAHFMEGCLRKCEDMEGEGAGLCLHDPFTVWYMLLHDDPAWKTPSQLEDIRVETAGHWTKGMHVVDMRGKKDDSGEVVTASAPAQPEPQAEEEEELKLEGDHVDHQSWRNPRGGNRIKRIISSPGFDVFKDFWMQRVYG